MLKRSNRNRAEISWCYSGLKTMVIRLLRTCLSRVSCRVQRGSWRQAGQRSITYRRNPCVVGDFSSTTIRVKRSWSCGLPDIKSHNVIPRLTGHAVFRKLRRISREQQTREVREGGIKVLSAQSSEVSKQPPASPHASASICQFAALNLMLSTIHFQRR